MIKENWQKLLGSGCEKLPKSLFKLSNGIEFITSLTMDIIGKMAKTCSIIIGYCVFTLTRLRLIVYYSRTMWIV